MLVWKLDRLGRLGAMGLVVVMRRAARSKVLPPLLFRLRGLQPPGRLRSHLVGRGFTVLAESPGSRVCSPEPSGIPAVASASVTKGAGETTQN